ncbi:MAG: CoB--CoM heterodisulfide reductase iron-sulfur subunit A family protein [Thermoplasmata archaeon]
MMETRIGVYICHCGTNIAGKVNIDEVKEYASHLKNVVVSKDYMFMCSEPGQEMIVKDIKEYGLNRIVVAACTETLHGHTFREAAKKGGLNPYLVQMVSIREFDSWVTEDKKEATDKAKDLIRAGVYRVTYNYPVETSTYPVDSNVLVVGAGIAGITASLVMADAGKHVYLVERQGFIGGNMAKFDKTFPTLDCASCILTPKMSAVKNNPNITLYTYSEVEKIDGFVGNFDVTIKKKPRYVREDLCIGCLSCIENCVYKEPKFYSEFDEGVGKRKPIYVSFPQAIPLVPVIDPETCIQFRTGKCVQTCLKGCPTKAIDFSMKEERVNVKVGAVVAATGFKVFDATRDTKYGFGVYPNVYTTIQMERMLNSAGPTSGEVRLEDGSIPKEVAIINCVGSRNENFNAYCSRVCCMVGLKHAHMLRDRIGANVTIFYTDIRANGKGYEEFYRKVMLEGVNFVRGEVASVLPSENNKLTITFEDTLLSKVRKKDVDMVILNVGLEPQEDWENMRKVLNLTCTKEGWMMEKHPKLAPVTSLSDGRFIAGAAQFPKDIPDTVAQAEAAAAEALSLIDRGYVESEPNVISIDENKCSGCKMCISVCPFNAISFNEEKNIAEVNIGLCKGCGACNAVCPSNAISQNNYTDEELFAEIKGVLKE